MIPASIGQQFRLNWRRDFPSWLISFLGVSQPGGFVYEHFCTWSRVAWNFIGCRAAVTNGSRRDNLGVPAVLTNYPDVYQSAMAMSPDLCRRGQ